MLHARIHDAVVVEVVDFDPVERFHPNVAALFRAVPDGTGIGATWDGKAWANPAPSESSNPSDPPLPLAPPAPKVTPPQFLLLFTPMERVAIRASTDPVVQDWLLILSDPRLTEVDLGLSSTQAGVRHLADLGLIAPGRAPVILAGVSD